MKSIQTEHGEFFPILDAVTGEVIQTAEEYYQEWLINKDKPQHTQDDKIDICLQEIAKLTGEKEVLAKNVYEIASILEVAIGVMSEMEVAE